MPRSSPPPAARPHRPAGPPGAPSRVGAALLALGASLGCISRSPAPRDWLATGFRTPEATLDAFRNALAADEPDLEYRCLSAAYRERLGVTRMAYGEVRDRTPFVRHMADAEVVRLAPAGPGRVVAEVRLAHLFGTEWFRIELVREDFYEVYAGGALVDDGLVPFEDTTSFSASAASALTPLPPGVPPETITELRVGREWKIDDFAPLDGPPPPTTPEP